MSSRKVKGLLGLIFFFAVSCGGGAMVHAAAIEVFVSILPQAYFVERLGTGLVNINVLVGPGQSPATYEPTPKQIARLGRAEIFFRIGTPFEEGFIDKMARNFPDLTIVDTRKGVPLLYFDEGTRGETPDPHIWLDPKRVKIQAATMCEALIAADPAHAVMYRKNLDQFHSDLDGIDARISAILKPLRGRRIYVFHPAFGYFADSYGLRQIAVETGGKTPSPKQLARLIDSARRDNVAVIFVQPQYSKRHAMVIAREIGGSVVPVDPLPQDYMKNLEKIAEEIRSTLTGKKAAAMPTKRE